MPVQHLLRASNTRARIVFAPHRSLRGSDGGSARGSGYVASDCFMIDVRLSTGVGNPTPTTDTSSFRACGHISRDLIIS